MAAKKKEDTGEVAGAPENQPVAATGDTVVMASVRKDGTPDQSPDFQFVNPEIGEELLAAQQADVTDPNRDHVAMLREEKRGR